MLKKTLGKKVISVLSAAVMATSATATGLGAIALTASAGNELGEGTFENGKGLPWHICENATGEMKFDITDGIYAILIKTPGGTGYGGEDRWDCQFRHRNLTIERGHTYRVTYSVNPTNSGHMYAKLGDMTNDDKEMWHGNGEKLSMTYEEGISTDDLVSKLKSASKTGERVDYGQGWDAWKGVTIPANQWSTYAYEFVVDQTDGAEGTGEWTFHMGGTGRYTQEECFPAGTIVRFDNLALVDMTDDKTDYVTTPDYEITGVEVNQVGYYPNAAKKATLILDSESDTKQYDYSIKDSGGNVVYTGTTDGKVIYDNGGWNYNQVIDFTDFTTEGKGYTLEVAGKTSIPFDISSSLLSGDGSSASMLTNAINYFYQNRSGIDTKAEYITSNQVVDGSSATLARKAGHNPDKAEVADEWVYIYTEEPSYGKSIDVTGGWYDAGDYGKYIVNGGISLWTLMNMYERSVAVGKADKWADGTGTVVIPETNNNTPDILDECKVELDFFLKMQREDGMVYHKMHDYKWTGLAVAPSQEGQPKRIVKPATYAATLNFAAACAQGARLFEDSDSAYAKTLKDAAVKAFKAAQDQYAPFTGFTDTGLYAPMVLANKGGGPYGDDNVSDEFYWAACELYITTGDKAYYDVLSQYGNGQNVYGKDNGKAFEVSSVLAGGENNNTCSLFTWGTLNSVGTISMYENSADMLKKGLLTQDEVDKMKESIIRAGDYYLDIQSKSAYDIPYVGHNYDTEVWKYDSASGTGNLVGLELEDGYEWGSNSMVINNAMALALAYDATGDVKYIDGVTSAFDYLMGRNPLEQSYVTGYGEHSTQYPHHRWWSGQLNSSDFPYAPAGVLSGGPNSNMEDPMVQGMGYKIGSLAPMKCYLDNVEAWSVNECTINWNSPLCWVVSFIEDEAPNIQRDGTKPTTTTTTDENATTTTTAATTASDSDSTTTSNSNETTATTSEGATTTTTVFSTPAGVLLGDVNLDGDVDLSDAVLLNKAVAGAVQLNEQATLNADCNRGVGITADDSMSLLKFLVHLIDALPE